MDRAYRDCVRHGWSREPIVEMVIPSTLDDSLAPPGAHVASLFCQHVAPHFADGSSWDQHRETVADLMIDTVEAYAPGFKASVIARQSLSPVRSASAMFGLPNGDIFHGALTLDQLFSARPMLGFADYRMPIPGLYLCGSGAHPGGGVTGAPGHNAAQAVIADLLRFMHTRVPESGIADDSARIRGYSQTHVSATSASAAPGPGLACSRRRPIKRGAYIATYRGRVHSRPRKPTAARRAAPATCSS